MIVLVGHGRDGSAAAPVIHGLRSHTGDRPAGAGRIGQRECLERRERELIPINGRQGVRRVGSDEIIGVGAQAGQDARDRTGRARGSRIGQGVSQGRRAGRVPDEAVGRRLGRAQGDDGPIARRGRGSHIGSRLSGDGRRDGDVEAGRHGLRSQAGIPRGIFLSGCDRIGPRAQGRGHGDRASAVSGGYQGLNDDGLSPADGRDG